MNIFKYNIISIITLIILIIVLYNQCNSKNIVTNVTSRKDTTYIIIDSTIHTKPIIVKSTKDSTIIKEYYKEYIPDTNYSRLLSQYNELLSELFTKNVYKDSVKIDSIGYVKMTDTIQKNLIVGRNISYNIKYPSIKETIILNNRQFYIGGGIQGSTTDYLNSLFLRGLYKTKKDALYGASIGINRQGNIQFEASKYWKIKLK